MATTFIKCGVIVPQFRQVMLLRLLIIIVTIMSLSTMLSGKGTTLYTHKMCPFAQKVWIALNAAGSPYTIEEIQLYGGKPDWFLKMNPKGLVPVLKHGETVVTESEDILEYIAGVDYPKKNEVVCVGDREEELWWRTVIDHRLKPIGKEAVNRGTFSKDLANVLIEMEMRLAAKGTLFLGGNILTLADASAFPFLFRLNVEYDLDNSEFPSLKRWLMHMNSIEMVSGTIVHSWWWWW